MEANQQNIVKSWDTLDRDTRNSVASFYMETWVEAVQSFCSQNLLDIRKAYDISVAQGRAGMGFVKLEWKQHPENDSSIVSIIAGDMLSLMKSIGFFGDALREPDAYSFVCLAEFFQTIYQLKQKGSSEVLILSSHIPPEKLSDKNGINAFYRRDDKKICPICLDELPFGGINISIDISGSREIEERKAKRQKHKADATRLEKEREDELYDWLRLCGVDAERQVQTSSGHLIDIWIPDRMMIEVKRDNITGNDICQCIEYASEYKLPIVLIGDKLNGSASRGLKGFNKLCHQNKIFYVSWDAAHDFLKGKLNLSAK